MSRPWSQTAVLLVAAACACGGADEPAGGGAAEPNVLLVVIDTLGAAHLGCYGNARGPSPAIDALAVHGVRFDRAYSAAPWTQPSVASIFTSQMPSEHGVQELPNRLAQQAPTLAEALAEAGLATHGVVSNMLLGRPYGFAQGFASYDQSTVVGNEEISSAKVTDAAIRWLERHADERFFLFVHYFDPHHVYNDHPEVDFAGGYDGPVAPGMPIQELRDASASFGPRDREELTALYEEEIAHTDRELGRLLARLDALELTERTLVVLTADHGEELLGHGRIGHSHSLYDDLLRVPLVLRLPGILEPGVIAEPVSLVDLAPTILDLAGEGARRPAGWAGLSLAPLLRGDGAGGADPERALFAEVAYRPPAEVRDGENETFQTALVRGRFKLIHDERRDAFELYDCVADPAETRDLAAVEPDLLERMKAELLAWERNRARTSAESVPLGAEELEELRKLGYLR